MNSRNEAILEIYLQRIRRHYADDIALAFTYGSTVTGDAGPLSDLDLVFVPKTKRGQEMAMTFILDGVGYDFFPMSWARLEEIASFDESLTSLIAESMVVYSASYEYEERFEQLRGWIMDTLDFPLRMPMVEKARAQVDKALVACANMQMATDYGRLRQHSAGALYYLSEAVCILNNRYFKRGIKRRMEELRAMRQLPEDFEMLYYDVIDATEEEVIRQTTWALARSVQAFYDKMYAATREPALPQEVLTGTYEEMCCNWKNKIAQACEQNDSELAFLAGTSLQEFLDTMVKKGGIRDIDVMRYFRANDLPSFKWAYDQADAQYLEEMKRFDVPICRYASLDAFRQAMLG